MTAPATDCAALIRRSQGDALALLNALRAAQAAQGLSMVEIARRTELPLRDLHDWLERGDLERFDICAASRVAVALGLTLGVTAHHDPRDMLRSEIGVLESMLAEAGEGDVLARAGLEGRLDRARLRLADAEVQR